jgi:predicted RNase H-like nuclease (RuvC/YqgF family)
MTGNEISSLKTDIALIQKDVKQIERVFTKVDNAVEQMSEILKTIAVQENILENNEKRVTSLEETIKKRNDEEEQFRKEFARKLDDMKETSQKERERHHRELLDSIENLNKSVNDKLDNQDKRIQSLENWRWYLLGIGAVLLFIVNKLPWESFFG